MKKIHLDTNRSMVIVADAIEQDGEVYLIKSGKKAYKIHASKVAYIEEDGLPSVGISLDPPVGASAPPPLAVGLPGTPRVPVLSKTLSEAIRRNTVPGPASFPAETEGSNNTPISIALEGDGIGRFHIMVDEETAMSTEVNEKMVSEIFSSPDISLALKELAVVGFKKTGDIVTITTKTRAPVGKVNIPAALTNMISQVGGMVAPSVRLPDIKEDIDENS